MIASLLITLREGIEAALIIGIILGYLVRTGNRKEFGRVWLGTGLGVALSVIAGVVIYVTAGDLTGDAEAVFDGSIMLFAATLLTLMIFWMRRQSVNIRGQLHEDVQVALDKGSPLSLVLLVFVAVAREGIETVLFLIASTAVAESALSSLIGGFLGLAVAAVIGYGIYKGSSRLNLRTFFNVTSVLLIIFAAGLVAHSIHEFNEVGVLPPLVAHVWDTSSVLPDESSLGKFLTAIFGYSSDPSLLEVAGYVVYLFGALALYFRPYKPALPGLIRRPKSVQRPTEAVTDGTKRQNIEV